MCLVAEDGVPNIAEMRYLNAVEERGILELASISQHASIADNHIASDVSAGADFAILTDDCWAFDNSPVLNDCPLPDLHIGGDVRRPDHRAELNGLQMGLCDFANPFQRVPDMLATSKQFGKRKLGQIQIIFRAEHAYILAAGLPSLKVFSGQIGLSIDAILACSYTCCNSMNNMLTKREIRELKGKGQHLEPVVRVGKGGLTPSVLQSIEQALSARVLIKVRFDHERDERDTLAERITEKSNAVLIMQVGKVAVFYRPTPSSSTGE